MRGKGKDRQTGKTVSLFPPALRFVAAARMSVEVHHAEVPAVAVTLAVLRAARLVLELPLVVVVVVVVGRGALRAIFLLLLLLLLLLLFLLLLPIPIRIPYRRRNQATP